MKATEHWTIIYNPTSGTYRPATLDAIQRALRDAGVRSVALGTDYAGHAVELCRAVEHTDRVACYSGDGTLNEVATGLLGRPLPIAFLPGGTANVMAHELRLPRDAVQAARVLLRGRPRAVRPGLVGRPEEIGRPGEPAEPGQVGGRLFLLMASVGFDAVAVRRVSPRLKAWSGKGAYVWAGLQALFERAPPLRVTAGDGERLEARWVVAARSRSYGGPFVVHPEAGLEAASLGVAAIGAGQALPFLVGNLGLGWARDRKGRRLLRQTRLLVEADEAVDLQVDGDYRGRDSAFEIGIADEAIRLCFPER